MHGEMEYESALNALVELVQEVEAGYGRQMQEELKGLTIRLVQTMAKLAEKDDELARAKERQELENLDYQKLKGKYADLQEKIAQEEARRLATVQSHEKEMRQRLTMESEISSLVNKCERASEEALSLQELIWALENENDFMKDSVDKLHKDVSYLQQEKSYWWHYACSLHARSAMLQQQLDASYAASQLKDQEIKSLREDIEDIHQMQEICEGTHRQPVPIRKLTDELQMCRQSVVNLALILMEDFKTDKNITSQAKQFVELKHELHSTKLELQATQEEALAMKQTNEEQKKEIEKLKDHLTDVNIELFESKLLQKKYQSAIKRLQAKE